MSMRRVKKTTNEQFDLLKAEMAVHHAAARGYGVGANRAIVDAEWKDIVEKLNQLGPPHRTMTEWKKVWSDVRLRMRKRFSEELMNDGVTPTKVRKVLKKPKKEKIDTEEDQLMDALNSSTSIYISQSGVDGRGLNDDEKHCITPNIHEDESQNDDDYYDHHNPLEEEELNSDLRNDNNHYDSSDYLRSTHANTQPSQHFNDEKLGLMEQTLFALQTQMEQQNKLMQHLTQLTTNMSSLMQRHVTALERKNYIKERQLRVTERNNVLLRRQEARKNLRPKSLGLNLHNKS